MKSEASVGTGVATREPVMTTSAPASASPAIVSVAVAPREMGVDLGAPRRTILGLFLGEAVALSAIGGLVTTPAGMVALLDMNTLFPNSDDDMMF